MKKNLCLAVLLTIALSVWCQTKFSSNGKFGIVDQNGNVIVRALYDDMGDFNEGMAAVELDGRWGFIDKRGNVMVKMRYDYVRPFSEGLAAVMMDGRWGFVDKQGVEVVKPRFVYVSILSEGLASFAEPQINIVCHIDDVGNMMNYGYIDRRGNIVILPRFKDAKEFRNGIASVLIDGEWKVIDKEGCIIN